MRRCVRARTFAMCGRTCACEKTSKICVRCACVRALLSWSHTTHEPKSGRARWVRATQKMVATHTLLFCGPFGQSNMHTTLDFCPRPFRKESNVLPLQKRSVFHLPFLTDLIYNTVLYDIFILVSLSVNLWL